MHWRRPARTWYALILAGFAASVRLGGAAEERMAVRPVGGQRLAGQSSGGDDGGGPRTAQKISKSGNRRSAQYAFQNFTGDKLEVAFSIDEKDFAAYNDAFGYTQEELDALKAWKTSARQEALKAAVKQGQSQAQLDAAIAVVDSRICDDSTIP